MNRMATIFAPLALLLGLTMSMVLVQDPKPSVVTHELEGKEECLTCHGGATAPVSHEGREDKSCLWCHAPDAEVQAVDPTVFSHAVRGRERCLMCHTGARKTVPAAPDSHTGRSNEYCQLCHKVTAEGPRPVGPSE